MNNDLNYYLGGIGSMFQEVADLAEDTPEGDVGWSIVLDIDRIPDKGLDWLSQFLGVTINWDEEPRQQIKSHERWGRGTVLSMIGPASAFVPENSKVYISERNPSVYHITFIFVDAPLVTLTYQSLIIDYRTYHDIRSNFISYANIYLGAEGDWAKVESAILANKPAGLQVSFLFANTMLYMAIYILFASYQTVYDEYNTYQEIFSSPFPDITLAIPDFMQLKSIRYYRNIYYQYQTYQLVFDPYTTY